MAQLIDLTVTRRKSANKDDNFSTPLTYGFDVEDIIVPVRNNGSKSYFTARQLKGHHPASKVVGHTYYEVNETLAQVAAKSDLLLLLTVTKRRGVAVNNEEYVFVASRFSENIKEVNGGGSRFFYQEDGDADLVEYEVSETIAQIVSQAVLPPSTMIEVTYAETQALVASCSLIVGEHYKITDRADEGIVLLAVEPCKFSLEGQGIFLNPDFQGVGDYSGVTGYNSTQGVWTASLDGTLVNGDVVFWNGLHYVVVNDAAPGLPSNPATWGDKYDLLSKSETNGYIKEVDFILYDFDNDFFVERRDKRGNIVSDIDGVGVYISNFQWGNDSVLKNTITKGSNYNCKNNRGVIQSNTLIESSVETDNTHEGEVWGNTFIAVSAVINKDSNKSFNNCFLQKSSGTILVDNTTNDVTKNYSLGLSTFEANLDMSNGGIFSANQLVLDSGIHNHVGIFNLLNNSGQTINKIANLPTGHRCRFYVQAGNNQIFSHTAVAGAIADQLISDAAIANTITGRTNGSDFIEYERAGNLNRRYNAVISV